MKTLWKNKQVWGTAIAVILLAFCVKDIKPHDVRVLLERVNYNYLIPATLTSFLFIILRALRWRVMVNRQYPLGPVRSVALYSAGQVLNIVMPVLTGQVGRLILFARKLLLRKTFIFSTIVLEVLFDAMTLVMFIFFTSFAFAVPEEYRSVGLILVIVTLVMLALLYLMMQYRPRLEEIGRARLAPRWPGLYITLKKFMRSFTKGISLLRSSQDFAVSVALSLAAWTSHVLVIWFLYESFGFELPIAAAATIMIINTIVLMVPLTPANAGTFEFAVSTSLAAFSVGRTDAVLFALALHLLDLLPIVVMGAAFFHIEKMSLRELRQHQDDTILDRLDENGTFMEEEKV